jgi:hypothetical protein
MSYTLGRPTLEHDVAHLGAATHSSPERRRTVLVRALILGVLAASAVTGGAAEAKVISTGILPAGAGDIVGCALSNVDSKPRDFTAMRLRSSNGTVVNTLGPGTPEAGQTFFSTVNTATGVSAFRCEFDLPGSSKPFRGILYIRDSGGTVLGALAAE